VIVLSLKKNDFQTGEIIYLSYSLMPKTRMFQRKIFITPVKGGMGIVCFCYITILVLPCIAWSVPILHTCTTLTLKHEYAYDILLPCIHTHVAMN